MDKTLLADGLRELGVKCGEKQLRQLETYLSEILLFNPKWKLVAQSDPDEIIIRHFLDSAAGVPYFLSKEGKRIVDLGTGAGFPGIILSVLMPEKEIVLAERMQRRVSFLKNVILRLGLTNVKILESSAEDIEETFDFVTARAFHPVYDAWPYMKRLVKEGGEAVLYKGPAKNVETELSVLAGSGMKLDSSVVGLRVPFLDEARTLLVIRGEKI